MRAFSLIAATFPRRVAVALAAAALVLLGQLVAASPARAAELTLSSDEYVVFHHRDALGSAIMSTDAQGQVLEHTASEPYGASLGRRARTGEGYPDNALAAARTRDGYTGHVQDTSTGLTYMRARHYDPELGRFLSNDPVGFVESNPTMFNRYAYANDNPYRYVDPDGRDARDVQIILSDIQSNFPGMRSPHSVIYEDLPEDVGGQATLDRKSSLVLPTSAKTAVLSRDEFVTLYDTVLHESMHVTDPLWQRIWDGFWGNLGVQTKNHDGIGERTSYEMIQPATDPPENVWDRDGEVREPKGVDPSDLFEETRESNDGSD